MSKQNNSDERYNERQERKSELAYELDGLLGTPEPLAPVPAKKGTTKKSLGDRVEKATKGLSGLDAAALVLQDAEPMTAKQIVEAIQTRKLAPNIWGKTPHATLYAAMITEISKKGKDSRFARGKEKGAFTSNLK